MRGFLVQDQPLYQFCVFNSTTVKGVEEGREGKGGERGKGERGEKERRQRWREGREERGEGGREGKGGEKGRELERKEGIYNVSRVKRGSGRMGNCFSRVLLDLIAKEQPTRAF